MIALAAMLAVAAPAQRPADITVITVITGSYGATTLELNPAAVDALTGLGVTPAPIAPARALPSGELAFPITNSFRNALRTGRFRHSGGISLTAGSTTVNLEDFVIDPTAACSPPASVTPGCRSCRWTSRTPGSASMAVV